VPRSRSFGISTQLYLGRRLARDHLREIAAAGFDSVELSATRTHFDFHSEPAIADLQGWLAEAGLGLASVHAPVFERFEHGRASGALNLASPDPDVRGRALDEATHALHVARRLPFSWLVVHAGLAGQARQPAGTHSRDAARRSVGLLAERAAPLGVGIAVELIGNELSAPGPLVHFVEDVLDAGVASICLDLGHAAIGGDPVEVIETVAEHIALVHAHDNRGRTDEHLVPFDGTIEWPSALTALQKVGYDGPLVIEPAPQARPLETLTRARAARVRMERMLATL
jgi:sugar phosphate isomerase/epimerase